MMKNITMNLKHLVLTFTLAIFAVAANAATVTYSLTTHVDNRTITGTANLAEGADLLNAMPQDLWRAYCTYKFYSDEGLTQEITGAPAGDATVYVDYVFDPPFILSQEGEGNVTTWHFIRTYNSGGDNNYLLYLKQKIYPGYEGIWGHKYSTSSTRPSYGRNGGIDPNADMAYREHCEWAFYGDSYSLNIKINDTSGKQLAGTYLLWPTTLDTNSNLRLGEKAELGWQLYVNTTQKSDASSNYKWYSYPTMVLGVPNEQWYMDLENVSYAVRLRQLTSDYKFDSHNQLVTTSSSPSSTIKNRQWWFGLYATPVGSGKDLNYNVTYKILQANGTWYQPDIVKPQTNSYGTPQHLSFPTEYTQKDGCTYDYYYKDADFTEKYPDNYTMPNTQNIVVYIKEIGSNYVAEQWKTLVLPYSIDKLDDYFGTNGVRVLKYTSVQGQLNGDAFRCNLIFTPVDRIEAYQPYLFKADHVSETVLSGLRHTVENMGNPIENYQYDTYNAPNIRVSMLGVLEEGGYTLPNDDLYFFFGSYPNGNVVDYENYTYKFYRQGGVTIPQFVCYFYVTDERPGNNAPIKASFGTESITGVSTIVADIKVQNSIYSLDGRKIDATSLDNLKRGIYIVNGRKVVK
ncbi:MAG: hypothetical protein IKN83_12355 [Bacteroidaceae bacterium]|nr:hypothetical protein [Bacteroidaceae bacterium]MBR3532142.1 hypothetical protein [Bacteroidaceae bacterium]